MYEDVQLLREYARTRSQAAFAELAGRYADLVFSAARRQTGGDAHLAEDVTQAVFIILAKKASSVPANRPLSAWLMKVTHYCAANARRQRQRRGAHERSAAEMSHLSNRQQDQSQAGELAPLLDEGINELPAGDRDALLLRFFEQRSLRQVGEALGVSEEAAQKRVSRAVEKLRDYFHRRGVTAASVSAVSALLSTQAVEAAPAGLAATAASAAGAAAAGGGAGGASAGGTIAKGVFTVMAQQKVMVAAAVVLLAALGVGGAAMVLQALKSPRARNVVVDAKAAANPVNQPSPWPVKFGDGTIVEVLALNDPDEPRRWWSPDGTPVDEPLFRASGSITMTYAFARRVDLIVRLRGVNLDQKTLTVRADPRFRTATLLSGTPRERLIKVIMAVPRDASSVDLRIGLGVQPWQADLTWDLTTNEPPPAKESLRFVDLGEEDGLAIVTMARPAVRNHDRDERVVVLANGKELTPIASYSKLIGIETYKYRCAKDKVTKVMLQSRGYEWMEMRNVSASGEKGTQAVQVSPLRAEAELEVRGTNP